MNTNSRWLRYLRGTLGVVGVGFIVYLIQKYIPQLSDYIKSANYLVVFASVLISLTGNIFSAIIFRSLLQRHGVSVPTLDGVRILLLSQVAKYIPGKVWSYILQMAHLPAGSKVSSMVKANMDMMVISLMRALIIGSALALLGFNKPVYAIFVLLMGALILSPIISGRYWRLVDKNLVLNFNLSIIGQAWLSGLLGVFAQYVLLVQGVGIDVRLVPFLISFQLLSWSLSVVLVIFPAGIGAREWAFIELSKLSGVATTVAAPVTLILRLWWITVDLAGAVLVFLIGGLSKERQPEKNS